MYGPLWRILPGPWWVKLLILLALIAAVIYALLFWVFPWIAPQLFPLEEVIIIDSPTS